MGSSTLLRGFKVSVATLDAFLFANGVEETYGYPPWFDKHPDEDPISGLLFKKIAEKGGTDDKKKFRVMIPSLRGWSHSHIAYVTYAWVTAYAQRAISLDEQLPEKIPAGFLELRDEILSHSKDDKLKDNGKVGIFLVNLIGKDSVGNYTPQELLDRSKSPQYCDHCDGTFDNPGAWENRQRHRQEVHGCPEGAYALPES